MSRDYIRATVALFVGCAAIFLGDWLLGVRIEYFYGIATFTFPWMLDVFLVPFIAGLALALIHKGRTGKYLAFLPPIIVRCASCLYLYLTNDQWHENFFFHLHLHYWGLAVILTMQASYLGGLLGGSLCGSYLRKNNSVQRVTGEASDTTSQQQMGDSR